MSKAGSGRRKWWPLWSSTWKRGRTLSTNVEALRAVGNPGAVEDGRARATRPHSLQHAAIHGQERSRSPRGIVQPLNEGLTPSSRPTAAHDAQLPVVTLIDKHVPMKRLLSAAVVAFAALFSFAAPVFAASAEAAPSVRSSVPADNFNEVASTHVATPEVMAWFDKLIALNPTAMVVWDENVFAVVSSTNTYLVRPRGPAPVSVTFHIE